MAMKKEETIRGLRADLRAANEEAKRYLESLHYAHDRANRDYELIKRQEKDIAALREDIEIYKTREGVLFAALDRVLGREK